MNLQKLMAGTLVTTCLGSALQAQDFRSPEEGNWYHPVEVETLSYLGADPATLNAVLARIATAKGARLGEEQPDTIKAYGAGNWIYEFRTAGEAAMTRGEGLSDPAQRRAAFTEAMVYFQTASSPHTNDPNAVAALERSGDAYREIAVTAPGQFEVLQLQEEGKGFEAYLHLPEAEGPSPLVVMSYGSDVSKESALVFYERYLADQGIGLLSLDMPGLGDSRAFDLRDGKSDKLHAAAVRWARQQEAIDADNIFVMGASFGGHAAARAFLARGDLDLAGVISICGPLHRPFMAPPEVYDALPAYTMDGVKTRLGLSTAAPSEEVAPLLRPISLDQQGLMQGPKLDTPLLVITTNADPVAPLVDVDALMQRARNGDSVVFDIEGHCPPRAHRQAITLGWIKRHLR